MAVNKRVDKLERDTSPTDPDRVVVVWSPEEAEAVAAAARERGEEVIEITWDDDVDPGPPGYDLSLPYPPSGDTNGGTINE